MRENFRQEASGVAVMPPGVILSYAGASAPAGWLLCDGTAYNGTTSPEYANLFAAIGNVWGGSDITDFKVPNNQGVGQTGAGTQTINARAKGGDSLGDTVEDSMEDHEHSLAGSWYKNESGGVIDTSTGASPYNAPGGLSTENHNGRTNANAETKMSSIVVNFIIKT